MSEPISVPPDLRQKFANFDGFSNLVSEQRRILDDIHRMNEDAGGHGDEVATKYHEYTAKGTENVSGLVEQIAGYLGLTGEGGHVTASTFDATEDGNQQLTTGWTPTPTNVGRPGH